VGKRTFDILKKLNLEKNSNSREEGKRKGYEMVDVAVSGVVKVVESVQSVRTSLGKEEESEVMTVKERRASRKGPTDR